MVGHGPSSHLVAVGEALCECTLMTATYCCPAVCLEGEYLLGPGGTWLGEGHQSGKVASEWAHSEYTHAACAFYQHEQLIPHVLSTML